MDEQTDSGQEYYYSDANAQIRDVEEKVRLMRDRVVLIGQNLIESKEKWGEEFKEIKTSIEAMRKDIAKIKEKVQILGEDTESYARREEITLMRKQFKMFEPLQFARIEDVERIVEEKLKELVGSQTHKKNLEKDRRGYIF